MDMPTDSEIMEWIERNGLWRLMRACWKHGDVGMTFREVITCAILEDHT